MGGASYARLYFVYTRHVAFKKFIYRNSVFLISEWYCCLISSWVNAYGLAITEFFNKMYATRKDLCLSNFNEITLFSFLRVLSNFCKYSLNGSQIILAMMIIIEINNLPKTEAIDVMIFWLKHFPRHIFITIYLHIIMLHALVLYLPLLKANKIIIYYNFLYNVVADTIKETHSIIIRKLKTFIRVERFEWFNVPITYFSS